MGRTHRKPSRRAVLHRGRLAGPLGIEPRTAAFQTAVFYQFTPQAVVRGVESCVAVGPLDEVTAMRMQPLGSSCWDRTNGLCLIKTVLYR